MLVPIEAGAAVPPNQPTWDTQRPSKVLAIQELVNSGVLSEQMMQKAKEALETHLGAQIAQQKYSAQAEELKIAHQAARRKGQLARETDALQVQLLETMDGSVMQAKQPTAFRARASLITWLEENRLGRHLLKFLEVGGQDLSLSDLALLTEEDVTTISIAMTNWKPEGLLLQEMWHKHQNAFCQYVPL